MTAAEFDLWAVYYDAYGFDADRLEWVTAGAGAAIVQSWGGRVTARELVPKFKRQRTSPREISAWLDDLESQAERLLKCPPKSARRPSS